MEDLGKGIVKGTSEVMKEAYGDLFKSSLNQIGVALGSIVESALRRNYKTRLNNAKRKKEFERNMHMLDVAYETIPIQNTIEIAPELAQPLLEKLIITSNEDIAKVFVNILTKAANSETAGSVHPAFVDMVGRLSADEAKIIQNLRFTGEILYVSLYASVKQSEGFFIQNDYLTLLDEFDLLFPQNIPTYISNLIGMGVLVDKTNVQKNDPGEYDKIKQLHQHLFDEADRNYKRSDPQNYAYWKQSYLDITAFGRTFISACLSSLPSGNVGPWEYYPTDQPNS